MHIELWKLSEIKPYPNNPRLNNDAVAAVAESIRTFGFRQPLVVDAEGVIVCGHTRYRAAQHLGLDTVPVHVATDLTPEQINAYRIADNKTSELADWDYDLLPVELGDLQDSGIEFAAFGFETTELERLLNRQVGYFEPGSEESQGRLDQKQPIRCPHCGQEFTMG